MVPGTYPLASFRGMGEGDRLPTCPTCGSMLTPVIADQKAPYDEAGSDHLSADPPYRQRCPDPDCSGVPVAPSGWQ